MAKVTYRGVVYDTDRNRGQQTKEGRSNLPWCKSKERTYKC